MEQRFAKLQEQVQEQSEQITKLTEQNQTLSADLTKLAEGLKTFLEKAAAEERDESRKVKFLELLLGIIALTVLGVVKESAQNVQKAATPGR